MTPENGRVSGRFLGKWILASAIGWPVGSILAIVISYAVVNLFYPKETNLVVGLFLGLAIGFAQWLITRKTIPVRSWWIWACAIGAGIPFIAVVVVEETGIEFPAVLQGEILSRTLIGLACGLLAGLLQMNSLKPYTSNMWLWVVASMAAWGAAFFLSSLFAAGFLLGGIVLGLISGCAVIWLCGGERASAPAG